MKRKAIGLLLAVLMCVGILAGCGGTDEEAREMPIDFTISGLELTLKDYALVSQPVEEGYTIGFYVLYEFPGNDVITAEEINTVLKNKVLKANNYYYYKDRTESEETRLGEALTKKDGEYDSSKVSASWDSAYDGYFDDYVWIGQYNDETERRPVIIGGIIRDSKINELDRNAQAILSHPAMAGGVGIITLNNGFDPNIPQNQQKEIKYRFIVENEDHLIEKSSNGTIISIGAEVDPLFKEAITNLIKEE